MRAAETISRREAMVSIAFMTSMSTSRPSWAEKRAARMMRSATSPRLATKIFSNMLVSYAPGVGSWGST